MPKLKEIIVASVLPAIKAVGKAEMEQVLSGVKEHNKPEVYINTLQGLHSVFSLLRESAFKSKSRIDDGIIDLVLEAVIESAGADRIDLIRREID